MLIIAGHIMVDPTESGNYVKNCARVVAAALAAPGCLDFSIAADTADPARIRIYERWEGEQELDAFHGSGPSDGQQAAVLDVDVRRYGVSSISDA